MICPHCAFPNSQGVLVCIKCRNSIGPAEGNLQVSSSSSLDGNRAKNQISPFDHGDPGAAGSQEIQSDSLALEAEEALERAKAKETSGDLRGAFLEGQTLLVDFHGELDLETLQAALLLMGRVSLRQGKRERALKYLQRAKALHTMDPQLEGLLRQAQDPMVAQNQPEAAPRILPPAPPKIQAKAEDSVASKPRVHEAKPDPRPGEPTGQDSPPPRHSILLKPTSPVPKEPAPVSVRKPSVTVKGGKPPMPEPMPIVHPPHIPTKELPSEREWPVREESKIPENQEPRPGASSPVWIEVTATERRVWVAGFWVRLLASMLDILLVAGVVSVVIILSSLILGEGLFGIFLSLAKPGRSPVVMLAMFFSLLLIYLGLFSRFGGQTAGKMLLKLRVIGVHGHSLSTAQTLFRLLGQILSAFLGLAGFIWVGFDRRRRGWHDRIGGTLVVRQSPPRGGP